MGSIVGRKTMVEELLRAKVIGKCWVHIDKIMDGTSEKTKTMIALKICSRTIPQEMDVTSGGDKLTTLEITLRKLSNEREDAKTSSESLQGRGAEADQVDSQSGTDIRADIQEALKTL